MIPWMMCAISIELVPIVDFFLIPDIYTRSNNVIDFLAYLIHGDAKRFKSIESSKLLAR